MRQKIVDQSTTIMSMVRSDRVARSFVWSVWLVMMLVAMIFLFKYTRNIPHIEDWFLVSPLTGNEPNLVEWLWSQNSNSEHRVPIPRLILLVLLTITHGDFRAGMLLNILILGALALAMIQVARSLRGGRTNFADAFFPIVLLHLGHSENMFWSWQVSQVIPTALACVILLVLVGSQTPTTPSAVLISGISLMLLPLNGANGLIFVPILALWLGYYGVRRWHAVTTKEGPHWTGGFLIGSAVIALGLMGLYFVGYERASWYPPSSSFGASLQAILRFLALGFGPIARSSWTLSVIAAISVLVPSLIVAVLGVLRHEGQERQRALGVLLFFGSVIMFAVVMGWGRAAAPVIYGFWPLRYVLFAVPAFCAAFFVWELYGPMKLRTAVQNSLFLGMFLLIPFNSMHGFGWTNWFLERDKWFEQDLAAGTPSITLAERHREYLMSWMEPDKLADLMRMLHEAGIEPFAQMREDPVKPTESSSDVTLISVQPDAQPPTSVANNLLVTHEIRYDMPEAGEVYLLWGLNGWQVVPEEWRPAGTEVKDNLMHTPLVQDGDAFITKIRLPAGTPLDYGFLITKKQGSFDITWPIWDGDYREVPSENSVSEVETKLTLALVGQEIHYDMPEADEVYLVWGLNGWHIAPETLRPAGTELKDKVMQTRMIREGDTFVAKVWVPIGTTIDYRFRITERQGLLDIVYPIWDGENQGYHLLASKDDVIEVKPTLTLPDELSAVLDNKLYFLAGIGLLLGTWLALFFFLRYIDDWLTTVSDKVKILGRNKIIFLSIIGLICAFTGLFIYRARSMMISSQISGNLTNQEIRYHLDGAGEVFLVWGINGWQLAPEEQDPAGTFVENKVMHTPMILEGDTFVAKVQVPAGTPLDYGFQIRKTQDGAAINWIWDGDYRLIPTKDDVVEVTASVTLSPTPSLQNVTNAAPVMQEIRYHLPEAGQVYLIWGINGWQMAPAELRPPGTLEKEGVLYTPMRRDGFNFSTTMELPHGTTIDYVFYITRSNRGFPVEVWDVNHEAEKDYHTTVTEAGRINIQGRLLIIDQITTGVTKFTVNFGFIVLSIMGVLSAFAWHYYRTPVQNPNFFLIQIGERLWQKRVLLILIVTSILYLLAINPGLYLWEDNAHYIIVGKSIATGQGFRDINYPHDPLFRYPIPIFPLMISPIVYFFDYNLWPLKIFVAVIAVGVVYLIYRLFKQLLDETHAILLTLFVAVSPQIVSFSHQVMMEIPYLFFFLLAVLYLKKYGAEEGWLTRLGILSALAVAVTFLTKLIGIAVLLAAIPYLLWDFPIPKRQALKKIALLIGVSGTMWLFFNYPILGNLFYASEIQASISTSDSTLVKFIDYARGMIANLSTYAKILPETILYLSYKRPAGIFTVLSWLTIGYGFLYCLLKKRTILDYYLLFYLGILLLFRSANVNLGSYQRYLVPLIPLFIYYFLHGFRESAGWISYIVKINFHFLRQGTFPPVKASIFRFAHRLSLAVVAILILFNFVATLQFGIFKTEPGMFDYYGLNNGFKAYREMALWTKDHTPPESTIITRRTYLYHLWSHRTTIWYLHLEAQASKEQVIQALSLSESTYIVLDTLDVALSASDQLIIDTVRQNPDWFELVYQNEDNALYRIRSEDEFFLP